MALGTMFGVRQKHCFAEERKACHPFGRSSTRPWGIAMAC
jgi:hypothetical protein